MFLILFTTSIIISFIYYIYYNSTKDITTNSDINEFLLADSVDEDI